MREPTRCVWPLGGNELYLEYHDKEWGVPAWDDRTQFEFLILEGAQAGLSWSTILNKRDGYRAAFAGFDPERIAKFGKRDVTRLMKDAGIVRNRLKIEATIHNARTLAALDTSFTDLLWSFAPADHPAPKRLADVPATTPESVAMAKELKKRGFRFVGPTTAYALMQATGMVDDHLVGCAFGRSAP